MKSASRTLVKSPPEVWEQLDHPGRMQGLMSALVGHATDVSVYEREEESKLAWKAIPDDAWIEVKLAEKGWGTNVSVTAENGGEATKLEGWLDAVIDELATPQKRPFKGTGGETEPVEPIKPAETPPAEVPVAGAPLAEAVPDATPAVEAPPPPPAKKKKRRRFFGF